MTKAKAPVFVNCRRCGTPFQLRQHGPRRYCSDSCRRSAERPKRKSAAVTGREARPCVVCGTTIVPTVPYRPRVHCGEPTCRRTYKTAYLRTYTRRRRLEREPGGGCRACGKPFQEYEAGAEWIAYCSAACRAERKAALKRVWKDTLKAERPDDYLVYQEKTRETYRRNQEAIRQDPERLARRRQQSAESRRRRRAERRQLAILRDLDRLSAAVRDDGR